MSVNDTVVTQLEKQLKEQGHRTAFKVKDSHIGCVAHVIYLAVMDLMCCQHTYMCAANVDIGDLAAEDVTAIAAADKEDQDAKSKDEDEENAGVQTWSWKEYLTLPKKVSAGF